MGKRKKIDWEEIEREYRVGQLSIREIARQFNCTEGAIRHRAKTKSWQRDLTEKVRIHVHEKLVRSEVRTPNAREEATEGQLVEAAATRGATVLQIHRKVIRQGIDLVRSLIAQLAQCAKERDEIKRTIEEETKNDHGAKRRNRMQKAVSLPTHAGVLRDLSVALKNLIPLERQAFNLDDDSGIRLDDLLSLITKQNPRVADRVVELLRDNE